MLCVTQTGSIFYIQYSLRMRLTTVALTRMHLVSSATGTETIIRGGEGFSLCIERWNDHRRQSTTSGLYCRGLIPLLGRGLIKHSGLRETCWAADLMRPGRLGTLHAAPQKARGFTKIQYASLCRWTQGRYRRHAVNCPSSPRRHRLLKKTHKP